jgi:multiple sugar transport system substrate-binding protein
MPAKLTQKQTIIIAVGGVIVIGALLLFSLGGGSKPAAQQKITLSVWGTEDKKVFEDLIAAYTAYRKGATVTYTQVDAADYQDQVLAALAAGKGPDVIEIGNRELPQWQPALAAMPSSTFAAQFDITKLRSYFPSVVESDFVSGGQIYALPFSIDTLAMIYNRDYFDSAGIATPPATWDAFEADVPKLRVLNAQGQITRAAAALGGSETSIADAPDILSLLMLQNGTTMTNTDNSSAEFAGGGASANNGLAALNFYLQFADAASPYYTWNDSMGDALQSFIQGKTAVIFNYQSSLAEIKAKAPFLNYAVAPMPQPQDATVAVNYPLYTGLAAAKQGNSASAWDFILYLTTYTEGENIYLTDTGAPPAQRIAISAAESDPDLAAFAPQALTARSWYEADDQKIDGIFNAAIQSALSGSVDPNQALNVAQSAVGELMSKN